MGCEVSLRQLKRLMEISQGDALRERRKSEIYIAQENCSYAIAKGRSFLTCINEAGKIAHIAIANIKL